MIPQPTEIRWRLSGTSPSLGARRLYSLDLYLSRPAVSILKEQGRGVLSASAPEISAYIDPFGPVVSLMIPLPTEIRWRLSGTSPSLGARRLYSLDLFLSHAKKFCSETTAWESCYKLVVTPQVVSVFIPIDLTIWNRSRC